MMQVNSSWGGMVLSQCQYHALQWRHNEINERDGVSNHQPHDCLLNRLFRADQRNIKAPRHWPLCGEFTGTGEFPAEKASNAENVSIWWRHHGYSWPGDATARNPGISSQDDGLIFMDSSSLDTIKVMYYDEPGKECNDISSQFHYPVRLKTSYRMISFRLSPIRLRVNITLTS